MKLSAHTQLFYGLVGLVVFLPLPLGSNRVWAWSLVEAWIFILIALLIVLNIQKKIIFPVYTKKCWFPFLCLVSFFALSICQLMPWDHSFPKPIDALNEVGWTRFSVDPYATLQASIKTLSFVCLFVLVVVLVNTEKRIKLILMCFFFSGLFQAVYGSFMTLTGIEHIFFMEKYAYVGKATGTFINRNHFANYLIMSVAAGTALLLLDLSDRKSSSIRELFVRILRFILSVKMLLRIGLAMCVVGIVLSQSRMGNTAFFIALTVSGFLWLVLTKRMTIKAMFLLSSIILIDLLVVGQWFGFEEVKQRLQNTSSQTETRDEVNRDTLVYIKDFAWVGSGGGSFYSVYPNYQSDEVKHFYKQAHNDYLQFLAEYGIIGTLFIVFFVISSAYIALATMIKRNNKVMQATGFCSFMVILALLIHSQVDFSLQITANAASAVVLLGLGWVARYLKSYHDCKEL